MAWFSAVARGVRRKERPQRSCAPAALVETMFRTCAKPRPLLRRPRVQCGVRLQRRAARTVWGSARYTRAHERPMGPLAGLRCGRWPPPSIRMRGRAVMALRSPRRRRCDGGDRGAAHRPRPPRPRGQFHRADTAQGSRRSASPAPVWRISRTATCEHEHRVPALLHAQQPRVLFAFSSSSCPQNVKVPPMSDPRDAWGQNVRASSPARVPKHRDARGTRDLISLHEGLARERRVATVECLRCPSTMGPPTKQNARWRGPVTAGLVSRTSVSRVVSLPPRRAPSSPWRPTGRRHRGGGTPCVARR